MQQILCMGDLINMFGKHSITMEEVLHIKSLEHVLQTYLNYTWTEETLH